MPQVDDSISERAKAIGNKAANLIELEKLSQSITSLPIKVQIPELLSFEHHAICTHLDKFAPTWRDLWGNFVQEQKKAEPQSILPPALDILNKIRELILETFVKHPLPSSDFLQYIESLPESSLLMVRSSSKEDSLFLANPGGNESAAAVEPTPLAISKAMGEVIASYFSEKSLKQRLLSGDDITEFPFMPVLLQRMIGEPMLGEKKEDDVICSGVMYTGDDGTKIQVAPGHGELIVNSKAPFDTFFVTREGVVYSEIYQKPHRLIPMEVEAQHGKRKRKLELHKNSPALQKNPAVQPAIAYAIASLGNLIEKHYGRPMDVEFVYHPKDNILYLVQARPIPKGDLKTVVPSSIPPEKLSKVQNISESFPCEVITPAGSAARVITNLNEILICDNISIALEHYLKQKNSPIKAVIVREMAPETSHEAAQFKAKAIPVMMMKDIPTFKERLSQNKLILMVDPQRKQVLRFTRWFNQVGKLSSNTAEKALRDAGCLRDGFFKSPMTSKVTLLPFWHQTIKTPSESKIRSKKKEGMTLGALLQKANSNDIKVSEEAILQLLHLILEQLDELKKYRAFPLKKEQLYRQLIEQIATLETATPGKNQNDNIWRALHTTLAIFYQLAKTQKGKARDATLQKIFQQSVITTAEIFLCLQRLSKDASTKIQQEYLGLISKLEGLVINPGKPEMFSDSLHQVALLKKSIQNAEAHPGFKTLTKDAQDYFVEFLKLEKLAVNARFQKMWRDFAFECCRSPKSIVTLSQIIKFCMTHQITADLMNNMLSRVEKESLPHEKMLASMEEATQETQQSLEALNVLKTKATLHAWEHRISEWANPHQFNMLWRDYEAQFLPLISTISIQENMSNLTKVTTLKLVQQMTEIMDKTIKSMKGSMDADDELKVKHFIKLLEPYRQLMDKWATMAYPNFSGLDLIEKRFNILKNNPDKSQLNPSGNFSVSSARLGSKANWRRQFLYRSTSLEDLFTLFHQNIIASTVKLNNENCQIKLKDLPDEIQPLLTSLSQTADCTSIDLQYPNILIEFNKPLNNHAAKVRVEYNQISKKTKLWVNFYGENWQHRMDFIEECADLDAKICEVLEISKADYNPKALSLEYCWELSTTQVKELAPHIKDQINTYSLWTFNRNPFDNYAFQITVQSRFHGVRPSENIKAFKHAKIMVFSSVIIEEMKTFLISLKKALDKLGEGSKKNAARLNELLTALPEIKNAYQMKELFYKVSIELAKAHDRTPLISVFGPEKFYAEWYAKIFTKHLQFRDIHASAFDDKTNLVIAEQYSIQLSEYLSDLEAKASSLMKKYNALDSRTHCYHEASKALKTVVTQIKSHLSHLKSSKEASAADDFIKACETTMDLAIQDKTLAQHRGARRGIWGDIWHGILNLLNAIRLISKEQKEYFMSTKSVQNVMDLKANVQEMSKGHKRN